MLRSLRLRLLLLLLGTISISTLISTLFSYHDAQHEIQELFDAQLAQEARIIHTSFLTNINTNDYRQLQQLLEQNASLAPEQSHSNNNDDAISQFGHLYERKIAFQIWDKHHRLVLRSLSAPQEPLSPQGLSPDTRGYHDVMLKGEKWRVFSLWNNQGQYVVQTGEEYEIREELAGEISLNWIFTASLALPLVMVLVLLAIQYGLAPLRSVVNQIRQRDPQHLKPIHIENTPGEIKPLLVALNQLFQRVSTTLERERQFTDDAAHELRTPLAALKTQAQVALRTSVEQEKTAALHQITQSVDRLTHLLQQLLNLARLGAGKIQLQLKAINLYNFSNELLSQLVPMALDKNIELEMLNETDPGIRIMAEETSLGMLLRNIMDNAIRYTPVNGKISVEISEKNRQVELCITDSGPGIPAALQERVFDRFYRITGSGENGCGLGLAIAHHCAELLQADIQLKQLKHPSGLQVCIHFKC